MASATPPVQGRRFSLAGLSTGIKMLLILTAALLPLGLIALFASIQSAHTKRLQHEADSRVVATAEARQIDILLLRGTSLIRSALESAPFDAADCASVAASGSRIFQADVHLALFGANGRPTCVSRGFSARRLAPPRNGLGADLLVLAAPGGLRVTVQGRGGSYGVVELPAALLSRAVVSDDKSQGIVLCQGRTRLLLSVPLRRYPLGQHLKVDAPIGSGQAMLQVSSVVSSVTATEVLLVLLPLLMWAAAAAIGWVVVDQLLVRPLAQLQRTVAGYGAGNGPLELPRITTPSQEIRALGNAFQETTAQLARREAELQEGLSHQMRLTREVHHRVKNNLQVVASLINLHARGTAGEVADAYASIQRRVDALAVVHRNHYAELEENRGVALRSIIAELTANLRATAPPAASRMSIVLDMMPAFVTQDVAVPVAFLVTEIIELVMACDPSGGVLVAVGPGPAADRATLSIEAPGLVQAACSDHTGRDRFQRVITGLARQLRAPLDYEGGIGRYRIEIAVLPQPDEGAGEGPKKS